MAACDSHMMLVTLCGYNGDDKWPNGGESFYFGFAYVSLVTLIVDNVLALCLVVQTV